MGTVHNRRHIIRALNFIGNQWHEPAESSYIDVVNPATGEVIGQVLLSLGQEVDYAVQTAAQALPVWSRTPAIERVQYLFKLKNALEKEFEELARTITLECGKTLAESRGELRRAIENVEVACGIPVMMQGTVSEDIASGIDEFLVRQPVGVCAIIAPFNFPAMIPFWFLPYAVACGNTILLKPSERVPFTMQKVFQILEQIGLPNGVVNLVNGDKDTAEAILEHKLVRAVSFVGSTAVAKHVYARATATGKRVQCHGGAKNPIIVLPDADIEMTTKITADSAFGCAGQRCLAASLAITVGRAGDHFMESIAEAAVKRRVGNGMDEDIEMGPVITPSSRERIENLIEQGVSEGAQLVVDGRHPNLANCEGGNFVRPTVIRKISPHSRMANTEIFGPVLGLLHAETIEDAISIVNSSSFGNMASLFTASGAAARKFRNEVQVGNVGINIGVAAPMPPFPFSGWKDSFFGDLHGQGMHAVEFFTQTKVIVERWPREWSRQF